MLNISNYDQTQQNANHCVHISWDLPYVPLSNLGDDKSSNNKTLTNAIFHRIVMFGSKDAKDNSQMRNDFQWSL